MVCSEETWKKSDYCVFVDIFLAMYSSHVSSLMLLDACLLDHSSRSQADNCGQYGI